jgi:hypothetical protein
VLSLSRPGHAQRHQRALRAVTKAKAHFKGPIRQGCAPYLCSKEHRKRRSTGSGRVEKDPPTQVSMMISNIQGRRQIGVTPSIIARYRSYKLNQICNLIIVVTMVIFVYLMGRSREYIHDKREKTVRRVGENQCMLRPM